MPRKPKKEPVIFTDEQKLKIFYKMAEALNAIKEKKGHSEKDKYFAEKLSDISRASNDAEISAIINLAVIKADKKAKVTYQEEAEKIKKIIISFVDFYTNLTDDQRKILLTKQQRHFY